MSFLSPHFLFYFLPFALIVHRLVLGNTKGGRYPERARLAIFLLTLIFYGSQKLWWLAPFLFCVSMDFVWATLIHRATNESRRKLILSLSIIQNVGMLAYFKYSDNLPPGISFFTFESMSFVIDVYRRVIPPPSQPQEFLAFIGMFPRFVAGPIVRYSEMVSQFRRYRGMDIENGLFIFAYGFVLKVMFADSFDVFVSYAFGSFVPSFASAWVGAFAYTMQIYFDFSGYSLMAIGLGRCLGFQFPSNFDRPYLSTSIKEFWRRWHMTLSRWLRDYLYISLGGNRHGKFRSYLNLFLTMLIGGAWHGAGWTFILWGAWHGLGLAIERFFMERFPRFKGIGPVFTFLMVMFGWVLFRARNLDQAINVYVAMVSPAADRVFNGALFESNPIQLMFCLLGVFYAFGVERVLDPTQLEIQKEFPVVARMTGVVITGTAMMVAMSEWAVPFLYYQF